MFSLILKWCNAGRHVPNLDVGETEDDDCPIRFKGLNCIAHFLEWLDTLTDKDTPSITVIAPSFQGYDGYFVVDDIRQNHIVEQVRNWGGGGELMQVNFGRICFIDSFDLWSDWAQERLFSPSFQHTRKPRLRRPYPRPSLLHAWSHVGQRPQSVWNLACSADGYVQFCWRARGLLWIWCQATQRRLPHFQTTLCTAS